MRDRFEEPFEFRVRTQGGVASSRRSKDSMRVGAIGLALGAAILCAVFWPSQSKKSPTDASVQAQASTTRSSEVELASEVEVAPRGGFEDMILNDRREEIAEVSALELADASLIDEEEAQESEVASRLASKNPVASTSYEERGGEAPIASSSFETQVERKPDYEFEEDEEPSVERIPEKTVEKNERKSKEKSVKSARTSQGTNAPGYFARAANLPGRHNSFSLRNFARATNLIDPNDAYSPRSITNAAQVDESLDESR